MGEGILKTYFVDTSAGPRIVRAEDAKQARRYILGNYLKSIRTATADDVIRLKDQEGFDVEEAAPIPFPTPAE